MCSGWDGGDRQGGREPDVTIQIERPNKRRQQYSPGRRAGIHRMQVTATAYDDLERLGTYRPLDGSDQLHRRVDRAETPVAALKVVAVEQQIETSTGAHLEQPDPAQTRRSDHIEQTGKQSRLRVRPRWSAARLSGLGSIQSRERQ